MRIAIDMSPMTQGNFLQHRVRGTGFYLEHLKKSLLLYDKKNDYIFFSRGEKLSKDIDIVHYPYFEPFFKTLPLKNRYKTVVTVHDVTPLVFPQHFPPGFRGKAKWQIQKYALKKADSIITDSQNSKNDIIKFTGIYSAKIHVVYLAAGEEYKKIESSKFKIENLRKIYNLPDKFALYVGDATWNKNLLRLANAVEKIKIPLVMVGKALQEQVLDRKNPWNQDLIKVQEIAKKSSYIKILGFLPSQDLVAMYNAATLFVMPSLYEGFGLPVLEAMSSGCPVVTGQAGSLKEVAGDAARFVDPYNTENIAKGIREVFSSSELQKELSEKGLTQAKKFTWKKTADQTIKVYDKTR